VFALRIYCAKLRILYGWYLQLLAIRQKSEFLYRVW
jgi:hypothetical protein